MKLNIFARLNSLEEALANKQAALEAMQNSIEKLSDLVVFQGKVIGHLNKYAKFYPTPVVNAPEPVAPQPEPVVPQPEPAAPPVEVKTTKLSEKQLERMRISSRKWYAKNKEALRKRRLVEVRKQKRSEYNRQYYLKQKAARAAKEQA
jgi:hypothetical protein